MAFHHNHGLTPYAETRYMQGRTQHIQPELHATAPRKIPNATLDEGLTLVAIETLKDDLPLPVLKHIIQLPPKCIEALLLLLNQVQNNISVDWLTNVVAALDPEDKRITVTQPPSQAFQDDGSFWTDSSATTCHLPALSIDGSVDLSHPPSNIPHTYNPLNGFYYDATIPHSGFDARNYVSNVDGNNLADTTMIDSPFDNRPDVGASIFTPTSEYDRQLDVFPNTDFVLIDTLTPVPGSGEQNSFVATFPPLQDNPSESTIGTRRSNTVRKRRSRRSTKASTPDGSLNIHIYKMPQVPIDDQRSPCPHCESAFISHTEFAAHVVAEHDRPTSYQCSHAQCDFVTYRATLLSRHHTNYHKHCPISQPRGVGAVTPCRFEQHKPHPRKIWGCWLCTWETRSGVESWARHQLEQHKGCKREDFSYTWLIKSLLSQPRLRSAWQAEIKQLEKATNTVWNLRWSDSSDDPARSALVEFLETGLWQGRNYLTDDAARQALVKMAMDVTKGTREALEQPTRHGNASPAPMRLKRLRSIGQNLRNRFTHEALPAPDTSVFTSSPRRQDSLPIRSSGRNRPATSHETA